MSCASVGWSLPDVCEGVYAPKAEGASFNESDTCAIEPSARLAGKVLFCPCFADCGAVLALVCSARGQAMGRPIAASRTQGACESGVVFAASIHAVSFPVTPSCV